MSSPFNGESFRYRGRFAPSPTGDLHFGSLVAAVASYLQAVRYSGDWLIRIENIDPPREVAGSAQSIVQDLRRLGFRLTGKIGFQGKRMDAYREACDRLLTMGHAYPCACSRSDLSADGRYPGTCRAGLAAGKAPRSIRLKTDCSPVTFDDAILGPQSADISSQSGDFIIWRADDLPSYQLAAAMDDAFPAMTEVVRGADLLDSTFRQILVQRALGLDSPRYAHIPVVTQAGEKLSKRMKSDPISSSDPIRAVQAALEFLGQKPPYLPDLDATWSWARTHWRLEKVPAAKAQDWPGMAASGPEPL